MKRTFTKIAESPRVYIYVAKDKCLYRVKDTLAPSVRARSSAQPKESDLIDVSAVKFFGDMNARLKKSSDVPMLFFAVLIVAAIFAFIAQGVSASSANSGGAAFPQISWGIAIFVLLAGMYGVRHVYRMERAERKTELVYKLSEDTEQEFKTFSKTLIALAQSERLWRVDPAVLDSDKPRRAASITRTPVEFGLKAPPYISANMNIYCLSLTGLLVFFFPDQLLLYDLERKQYDTLRYNHVSVSISLTSLVEEDAPPKDGRIKRYAQLKPKDSTADQAAVKGRKVPIVEYAALRLVLSSRLTVGLLISNEANGQPLAEAFASFKKYQMQSKPSEPPRSSYRQQAPPPPVRFNGDPFVILKLQSTASWDEISAAYRQQAQLYHPDKVANLGPEFQELANSRMKEINSAYEELKRRYRR